MQHAELLVQPCWHEERDRALLEMMATASNHESIQGLEVVTLRAYRAALGRAEEPRTARAELAP